MYPVRRPSLLLLPLSLHSGESGCRPCERKACPLCYLPHVVNSCPAHSGQEARNREKEEERETKQFKRAIRH
ncbi:hypothetical protein HOY82DRAFT_559843 [Tuber indicum]|nr:hypothetical protein HOY82DRAFT_559843 [Tuber indicum]